MMQFSRREFLKVTGLSLAAAVVSTSGFLALHNEANQAQVFSVTIPIKGLHASLEGFKILQMSDFHLYPYTRPELVRQAVDLCNTRNADLAVLTGDFVWLQVEAIFELTTILSGLQTRHGVYAVIGNHDIWTNVDVVRAGFERERIPVLMNQGLPISVGKGSFYLAGLDDGQSGQPDLQAALEDAPPGDPVVLLFHEPDLADKVSLNGRVSLQLAGHTHGGQVRLPGIGAFILPYLGRKYDYGLYRVNQMWLYTNGGIGTISVPVRYRCPPEITEIILVRE
jgi:predicted MPP superfamily phosphohydrolase